MGFSKSELASLSVFVALSCADIASTSLSEDQDAEVWQKCYARLFVYIVAVWCWWLWKWSRARLEREKLVRLVQIIYD